MSNYTPTTDFSTKDNLTSGNASKVIKGSEVDAEFSAISTAISSKQEASSTIIPVGSIMLFIAKSVPSGWSLVNTWNEKSLVLSSSITSSNAYTTGGSWTIGTTQLSMSGTLESHTHTDNLAVVAANHGIAVGDGTHSLVPGGNTHGHNLSGSVSNYSGTQNQTVNPANGTMANGNWRPAYVEIIACSKD